MNSILRNFEKCFFLNVVATQQLSLPLTEFAAVWLLLKLKLRFLAQSIHFYSRVLCFCFLMSTEVKLRGFVVSCLKNKKNCYSSSCTFVILMSNNIITILCSIYFIQKPVAFLLDFLSFSSSRQDQAAQDCTAVCSLYLSFLKE